MAATNSKSQYSVLRIRENTEGKKLLIPTLTAHFYSHPNRITKTVQTVLQPLLYKTIATDAQDQLSQSCPPNRSFANKKGKCARTDSFPYYISQNDKHLQFTSNCIQFYVPDVSQHSVSGTRCFPACSRRSRQQQHKYKKQQYLQNYDLIRGKYEGVGVWPLVLLLKLLFISNDFLDRFSD